MVIGGTSMLPGFKHRLMTELQDLVSTPKYRSQLGINTFKFHSPPAKDNCVGWLGGISRYSLCLLLDFFYSCVLQNERKWIMNALSKKNLYALKDERFIGIGTGVGAIEVIQQKRIDKLSR